VYVPDFEGDCEAELTAEEGQRVYKVLLDFLRMQKLICEKFGVPLSPALAGLLEELDDLEDVIKFHVKGDQPPEGWD
jgi:hypothetical protein